MAELKIALTNPITTTVTTEVEQSVTEVTIKRIVVVPELDTMRVIVDLGGKEIPFVVNGEDYTSVVSNCDVAAIIAILQTKLEATVATNA